jgi:hypothetical protein
MKKRISWRRRPAGSLPPSTHEKSTAALISGRGGLSQYVAVPAV